MYCIATTNLKESDRQTDQKIPVLMLHMSSSDLRKTNDAIKKAFDFNEAREAFFSNETELQIAGSLISRSSEPADELDDNQPVETKLYDS